MKTDDLIDMLASGPDVRMNAPRTGPDLLRLLAGLGASVLLMLATLGMRAHLWQAFATPAFWIKFVFALALAAGAGLAARRLAVPGASLRHAPLFVGLPLLAIWLLAAIVLWQAAPDERAALLWGRTWRVCAPLIAMISLPVFGAALLVMRRRAPTRLRLAGGVAGLAAGAAGAVVYCLHCPETSPVFVGVWYVLGMSVPAAIGALVGPRVLAW